MTQTPVDPAVSMEATSPAVPNSTGPNNTRRNVFIIVLVGSIIASISLGVRATMGLYVEPIEETLGVSTATLGFTFALQNLMWGLGQPLAGGLADRFGTVRVLIVGAGIYATGLLVMANASTGFGLHLGGGVIVGFGLAAASFTVVLAAIGQLVDEERRSKALGIVTACGSLGHFILVPLTGLLIDALSWETALLLMAAVVVSIVLVARPLRSRPDAHRLGKQAVNGTQALNPLQPEAPALRDVLRLASRHRSYLMINAAFFACGFHVTFVALHLPKHLTDEGQSDGLATLALALIGLFNVIGAFGAGWLGATRNKSKVLTIVYMGRALTIASFMLLPSNTMTVLGFSVALGLLWLATVPLTSGIVLNQFGPTHIGTLFGLVFWSHQVGAFVGAYGGGIVRDALGSYTLWWWASIAVALMAATLHLIISDAPVPGARTAEV